MKAFQSVARCPNLGKNVSADVAAYVFSDDADIDGGALAWRAIDNLMTGKTRKPGHAIIKTVAAVVMVAAGDEDRQDKDKLESVHLLDESGELVSFRKSEWPGIDTVTFHTFDLPSTKNVLAVDWDYFPDTDTGIDVHVSHLVRGHQPELERMDDDGNPNVDVTTGG